MREPIEAFRIRPAPSPWGDYGRALTHGLSRHLPRVDGRVQLERTAPFIPPISFPGPSVVTTDAARRAIETAGLTGAQFRPVDLARIVRLDWRTWDLNASGPPFYPPGHEPEAFILDPPHDSHEAAIMAPLWECEPQRWGEGTPEAVRQVRPRRTYVRILARGSGPMPALFKVDGCGFPLVSPEGREWFETEYGEWVRFEPAGNRED